MKKYILFDARARYDIEKATALSVSDSLEEAMNDRRTMFSPDSVIVQYDTVEGTNRLENQVILDD